MKARPGCTDLDTDLATAAALAASEILYRLSGQQFSGECSAYVRPNARPRGWDVSSWSRMVGGYLGSWGVCGSAYGSGMGAATLAAWLGHSCTVYPAELELGAYPVTGISVVKINGQTIPATEYRVDDHRLLVRIRQHNTDTPTARPGWPICQRLDLPDTEDGTFSVTFSYGMVPPRSGVDAAATLAAEFALARAPGTEGVETRLPERVRSLVRQGESITLIDPQDVLDKGRTGIPEVDLFIKAFNPNGLQRRSTAWSPDTGRARRPTWSST